MGICAVGPFRARRTTLGEQQRGVDEAVHDWRHGPIVGRGPQVIRDLARKVNIRGVAADVR